MAGDETTFIRSSVQPRRLGRAQPTGRRLIPKQNAAPWAAFFAMVADEDQTSVSFCVTSKHIIPITATVNSSRIARMKR